MDNKEVWEVLNGRTFNLIIEITVADGEQLKRLEREYTALCAAMRAIEKQMPATVYKGKAELYECPCCNSKKLKTKQKFCSECGQALDWSDRE